MCVRQHCSCLGNFCLLQISTPSSDADVSVSDSHRFDVYSKQLVFNVHHLSHRSRVVGLFLSSPHFQFPTQPASRLRGPNRLFDNIDGHHELGIQSERLAGSEAEADRGIFIQSTAIKQHRQLRLEGFHLRNFLVRGNVSDLPLRPNDETEHRIGAPTGSS